MKIHPTALIDSGAVLGENVEVGPYAVIEGGAHLGDGCVIQSHAIICSRVTMGTGNLAGYGCVIGGDPQDFAFDPSIRSEVRIGDGNKFREHCTIHRGTKEGTATVVGNGCYLMAGAHLAHNAEIGDHVVIANNALLGGYTRIEERVFIGGGSVFHQNMRVGRLAMTQGISGYSKYVPPYCIGAEVNTVAGLNVVGMRRAGFTGEQRREIKEAFDLLYRSGLNTSQALAASKEREWRPEAAYFWEFVGDAKKRGVCAFIGESKNASSDE